jgi:antitoxin (DNA-binding transcriptional repressor) of toxin-antitoxin stability system
MISVSLSDMKGTTKYTPDPKTRLELKGAKRGESPSGRVCPPKAGCDAVQDSSWSGRAVSLTRVAGVIDFTIMSPKTATVAELRNNFRRVSAWIENGEAVEIVKRGRPFARLQPLAEGSKKPVKVDFARQLRATWGKRVFSADEVGAMREAELGGRA